MKFFLFERRVSQKGTASKILYPVPLAAQVREAKLNGNDTFWQCCFASRTKWVRRYIIHDTTSKHIWDVYLSYKQILWKNLHFSRRYDFFTGRSWVRTLIDCDSSQKRDTKPRLGRKILTFATGTLFLWKFLCRIDTHPRHVLKWYLELYNVWLTWCEKQSNIVKMYHYHFILLLVPERQATPDTKFCSQYLSVMLVFQTKKIPWKKSACSKN